MLHKCSQTKTFVPKALEKPCWSAEHPKSIENWNVERDVFLWLNGGNSSIEETIAMYRNWLESPPMLFNASILRRFFSKISLVKCHHELNTQLKRCPECEGWYKECIEYLEDLLPKVKRYYQSKDYWTSLNPYVFEHEVAALFRRHGWIAYETKGSGDEGADIIIEKGNQTAIVQCKLHSKHIGPSAARELLGTVVHNKADFGILVCSGGFTSGVYSFAGSNPIKLMDIESLLNMHLSISNE